jgi:hypothetical protein
VIWPIHNALPGLGRGFEDLLRVEIWLHSRAAELDVAAGVSRSRVALS